MRHTDFDDLGASLRPKSARLDPDEGHDHGPAAAAAGRTDALDSATVLGLQRAAGNAATTAAIEGSSVHSVVGSGGSPLDADLRSDMEARFGQDFGDVRVHTGSGAHDSAKAVGAHAYTVGSDIVFQRDAWDPGSDRGRTTLAHELTHVVQQRQGPVDGTPASGGVRVSDPSDRFEREAVANADRVMAGPAPVAAVTAAPVTVARCAEDDAPVQRDAEEEPEEEASVQGLFVQREEDEEQEPEG